MELTDWLTPNGGGKLDINLSFKTHSHQWWPSYLPFFNMSSEPFLGVFCSRSLHLSFCKPSWIDPVLLAPLLDWWPAAAATNLFLTFCVFYKCKGRKEKEKKDAPVVLLTSVLNWMEEDKEKERERKRKKEIEIKRSRCTRVCLLYTSPSPRD